MASASPDATYLFCEREQLTGGDDPLAKRPPFEHDVAPPDRSQRDLTLRGFQLYCVEQWLVSRSRFVVSFIVSSDNPSHTIKACSLHFPHADESLFLRNLSKFTSSNGLELKETEHGRIYVGSLATVDPSLNLMPIANGDLDKCLSTIRLNINLKRLGCGTRAAISTRAPADAQAEKFFQAFRILRRPTLDPYVGDMVQALQTALALLGFLPLHVPIDGMFCDETLDAVREYRSTFMPSGGGAGGGGGGGGSNASGLPAASGSGAGGGADSEGAHCDLGLAMSALIRVLLLRSKLSMLVKDVVKDPFTHRPAFLRNVAAFQRTRHLPVTQVLDAATADAIEETLARSATGTARIARLLRQRLDQLNPAVTIDNFEYLTSSVEFTRRLWHGSKKRGLVGDSLFDPDSSANKVEGLIQGGKEFATNLLKGVGVRDRKGTAESSPVSAGPAPPDSPGSTHPNESAAGGASGSGAGGGSGSVAKRKLKKPGSSSKDIFSSHTTGASSGDEFEPKRTVKELAGTLLKKTVRRRDTGDRKDVAPPSLVMEVPETDGGSTHPHDAPATPVSPTASASGKSPIPLKDPPVSKKSNSRKLKMPRRSRSDRKASEPILGTSAWEVTKGYLSIPGLGTGSMRMDSRSAGSGSPGSITRQLGGLSASPTMSTRSPLGGLSPTSSGMPGEAWPPAAYGGSVPGAGSPVAVAAAAADPHAALHVSRWDRMRAYARRSARTRRTQSLPPPLSAAGDGAYMDTFYARKRAHSTTLVEAARFAHAPVAAHQIAQLHADSPRDRIAQLIQHQAYMHQGLDDFALIAEGLENLHISLEQLHESRVAELHALRERAVEVQARQARSASLVEDLHLQLSRLQYQLVTTSERLRDTDEAIHMMQEGLESLQATREVAPTGVGSFVIQGLFTIGDVCIVHLINVVRWVDRRFLGTRHMVPVTASAAT